MLTIAIPDSADTSSQVSLGGELYDFRFSYNDIDRVYRLAIYKLQKKVITSIDLKTGALLLQKHTLPDFDHGDLFLAKVKARKVPPERDNVGVGKDYELVYMTNTELGR